MSGVDDRIVSMKFDNAVFEQKMAETVKSLDKLRQSLDFASSKRGMDELSNAGKNFNMGNMGSTVDGVSAKFLAFATIGITALSAITSRAIQAGASVLKAFTIEPLKQGFHEYETQLNSVQTILANTASAGTTLDQVNAALQKLNEYSDTTIYNFGEMAKNIGTFTAAGVDLDTSVKSIKGIANLAALSGSSALQASSAMYQLSQAIATGTLRLIDWKSVENAGIGGEVFKNALFETGKAMKTLTNVPISQTFDQWEKANGSFRSSLAESGTAVDKVAASGIAARDSAKMIAKAEQSAAESIEDANQRIIDAKEDSAKVAKSAAKDIAAAEEAQVDVITRSADDIANAIENQNNVIEDSAADVQNAIDAVTDAQKRLQEAMKPASADDLQAATDRLTTAQLDQSDLATAIEDAERDQQRAAEDLAEARLSLISVQEDAESSANDLRSATRRVEDGEARVADLMDAVIRARLRQNEAIRSTTEAQTQLIEVQQKGTDQDQNVIDAQSDLVLAIEHVKDVELESAARRQQAVADVAQAREDAATREIEASQHLAEVTIQSEERQADSVKRLAEAEKAAAKTRISAQESIAQAHESASQRISSAGGEVSAAADGWITSEVLTTTLAAFTDDISDAELAEKGFTQAQIDNIRKVAETARKSAQDVKTFTQLLGVIKEAIGTGWADSFRTVIGNFTEARAMWTNVNNVLGTMINNSADARNALLQGWADLGGRTLLIEALGDAFNAIGRVLIPIGKAFREIFPKKTSQELFEMTQHFAAFAEKIKIVAETIDKIKRIFAGFFALLEIGWTIFKGILGIVGELIGSFTGVGEGVIDLAAGAGDAMVKLNKALVDGGKIHEFFEKLSAAIQGPIKFIKDIRENLVKFFTVSKLAENAVDNLGQRFNTFSEIAKKYGESWLKIVTALGKVWNYISTWFKELGTKLAAVIKPGDFDAALDVINVGLLGGIVLMLRKFLKGGLKFGIGDNLFKKISQALDGLTGSLKAMQTNLKAQALQKIAIAVGVLAASILVLSMIDSAALTKALTAITVGFAQLIGAMTLMDQLTSSVGSAAKIGVLATSLILLSSAMVILSVAVKNLSSLSWAELAKGLAGATVMLAALTVSTNLIASDTSGMIRAGIALTAISVALFVLSKAVKSFSEMSWTDMGKGLAGIGVGLGIIAGAMHLMPPGMIVMATGLVILGTALNVIALAVKSFAEMSWTEMGKGLLGIGAGLVIIAGAMHLMPPGMIVMATGLTILGVALNLMAAAVKSLSEMALGEMAKGLGALAAMLLILAVAMNVMNGTIAGATALIIVSGALVILAHVLKELGDLKISQLVTSIAAIAAILVVLAVASTALSSAIPFMLGFGAALTLIGAGFALFGVGAMFVAKAFELVAKAGKAGAKAIVEIIAIFVTARLKIVQALVGAILDFAKEMLESADMIIRVVKVFLGHVLDTIIELVPKIAEALSVIITSFLKLVREKFPDILKTGFEILLTLLKGIRDNMPEIVKVGVEIIVALAKALTNNMQTIIDAALKVLFKFLETIADRAGDIVSAGTDLIISFLLGITKDVGRITDAIAFVIVTILKEIADSISKIITAGVNILVALLKGISDNLIKVVNAVTEIITKFIAAIGSNYIKIIEAGFAVLRLLLKGITDNLIEVITVVGTMITKLTTAIGDEAGRVIAAGVATLRKFIEGLTKDVKAIAELVKAGVDLVIMLLEAGASNAVHFADKAGDIIIAFLNGMAEAIKTDTPAIHAAGFNLAMAIMDGMTLGFASKVVSVVGGAVSVVDKVIGGVKDKIKGHSPSKVFIGIGQDMMQGLVVAFKNDTRTQNSAVDMAERVITSFQKTLSKIPDTLAGMDEFNPVITPVLDLTKVRADAKSLDSMIGVSAITPEVSYARARVISTTADVTNTANDTPVYSGPSEITFEQNIYAPTALSTDDIYRNTRSQIALAKEELSIP